jgi:hypothetical protein
VTVQGSTAADMHICGPTRKSVVGKRSFASKKSLLAAARLLHFKVDGTAAQRPTIKNSW